MTSAHRPLRISAFTALLVALVLTAGRSNAASTAKVVAISDAAPGGGVFAGPAFTTWPGAGGTGWVAFRTRLEGASASEALVLAGLAPPLSRVTVAQIGDSSPAGRKLRAFVGRPTVDSNGDVAFLATLATSSDDPADAPIPAALFLFRRTPPAGEPALIALAVSGDTIPAGVLDLAGDVDPLADATTIDVPERGPVMNAAGAVAFLAVVRSGAGAIVTLCTVSSGGVIPRARLGDPFRNGKIIRLGPPSLNGAGTLAFTATVDGPNGTSGIFTLGTDGLVERVARGTAVELDFDGTPGSQTLIDFGDVVSIGDDGTLAFTAGPILDKSRGDTVGAPAAFAFAGDILHPVLYPGQRVRGNLDRVRGVLLGNAGAFATAPPVVTADGSVVAAASLNGGSVEAVLRSASPEYKNPERLATTNGPTADASPAGGTYAGLESGPAVDAAGGVAFRVRVAGGYSSEAIIYRPGTGPAQGVFVGEGSPTDGFFAGAPFSTPRLNDRGDVVFRGYVANGPSSVGLFKASTTGLEALVRSGDPSPLGNSPFVDFPGDPSLNAGGTVAFTATVLDKGRGIFLIDRNGPSPLVRSGDPAPGPGGAVFNSFGSSPSLSDAGDVAFRASIRYRNATTRTDETLEGLFLATGTSIQLLASAGQPSPTGPPFLQMRDPLITAVPSLVFAAPVGTDAGEFTGVFAADAAHIQTVVSERQVLGAGVSIDDISSAPATDAKGDVAFLASRRGPAGSLGPAILRRAGLALEVLLARGDTGPAGGVVKSLSQPTMNRTGHVAFRTTYQSGTGAATNFLLANEGGLVPVLAVGEPTAGGGRVATLGARASLNADDTLAVVATIARAPQRIAILLASPTQLSVPTLGLKLSARIRHDRLRLAVRFAPGRVTDGFDPESEPIVITLLDTTGEVWTTTVDGGALQKRGRAQVLRPRHRPHGVKALRLETFSGGVMQLDLRSSRIDLTNRGTRRLLPPFTVAVEFGDDAGSRRVPCTVSLNGATCSAP